jgi:hypothetical protein
MSGPPAIRSPRATRIRRLVVRAAALDLARLVTHDPALLDDGRRLGAAIVLGYRLNFREFVLTVRLAARMTQSWAGSRRAARDRFDQAFLLPPPDFDA